VTFIIAAMPDHVTATIPQFTKRRAWTAKW